MCVGEPVRRRQETDDDIVDNQSPSSGCRFIVSALVYTLHVVIFMRPFPIHTFFVFQKRALYLRDLMFQID